MRYGRVKIEDQIGEILGAKVVILLVGERPGLGQSKSSLPLRRSFPWRTTAEADRTCISNIHQGTPPAEAAAVTGFGQTDAEQESVRHQHDPLYIIMLALDFDSTFATAMRVIAFRVNDGFCAELKLPPHIRVARTHHGRFR